MTIKRGDIVLVDFKGAIRSEQGGVRPAIVIQNDTGNKYSPTTLVCPITSRDKKNLPTHMPISSESESGLEKDSVALFEQIRTVDKCRILKKIGFCNDFFNIYRCISASFGIG